MKNIFKKTEINGIMKHRGLYFPKSKTIQYMRGGIWYSALPGKLERELNIKNSFRYRGFPFPRHFQFEALLSTVLYKIADKCIIK